MWNGRDPILKERMFGLTNSEGNHGEDVKEYYFYLDSTPTHSYLRFLYKYPQAEYPYNDLVATNRARGQTDFEYELLDTGVFDDDRYFDVVVEYAKASAEDLLVRVTVHNRGPEPATLHLLPTLLVPQHLVVGAGRREARACTRSPTGPAIAAEHADLGTRLAATATPTSRCCSPRTRPTPSGCSAGPNRLAVRQGRDRPVRRRRRDRRGEPGPASAPRSPRTTSLDVAAGGSATVRLRLTDEPATRRGRRSRPAFDELIDQRRAEADEFYAGLHPSGADRGGAPGRPAGAGRDAVEQAVLRATTSSAG